MKQHLNKYTLNIVQIIIVLLIVFAFRNNANLCPSWDMCYSRNTAYQIQVLSFLEGSIGLSNSPSNIRHDWGWGVDAVYQLWGLGVPIMRFPFELATRILQGKFFPDTVVLLTYIFITAIIVITSSYTLVKKMYRLDSITSLSVASAVTSFFILAPEVGTMLLQDISTYHEAVAYAYYFNVLALFLTLKYIDKFNYKILLTFVLCGFAVLIRPTAILYSGALLLSYLLLRLPSFNFRQFAITILCFVPFPLMQLILNFVRFGKVFEFGYGVNLSSLPLNDYSLRFGSPYLATPLELAIKELWSALFYVESIIPYSSFHYKFLQTQSQELRFRRFYFHAFSNVESPVIILSILICFAFIAYNLFIKNYAQKQKLKFLYFLSLYSLLSFFTTFCFYLYSPAITSRYVLDFSLCFNCLKITTLAILAYMFKNLINLWRRVTL